MPMDGVHEYPLCNNANVAICNFDIDGVGDMAFFIIDRKLKHLGAFDWYGIWLVNARPCGYIWITQSLHNVNDGSDHNG